jgi:hypothetical protein
MSILNKPYKICIILFQIRNRTAVSAMLGIITHWWAHLTRRQKKLHAHRIDKKMNALLAKKVDVSVMKC